MPRFLPSFFSPPRSSLLYDRSGRRRPSCRTRRLIISGRSSSARKGMRPLSSARTGNPPRSLSPASATMAGLLPNKSKVLPEGARPSSAGGCRKSSLSSSVALMACFLRGLSGFVKPPPADTPCWKKKPVKRWTRISRRLPPFKKLARTSRQGSRRLMPRAKRGTSPCVEREGRRHGDGRHRPRHVHRRRRRREQGSPRGACNRSGTLRKGN